MPTKYQRSREQKSRLKAAFKKVVTILQPSEKPVKILNSFNKLIKIIQK